MKQAKPTQDHATIATAGELLPDGTLLDLSHEPTHLDQFRLVIRKGNKSRTASQFEFRDHLYIPAKLDRTFARAIQMPGDIVDFGTTRDLFEKICKLVQEHCAVTIEVATTATYFVFATWFADFLSEPPRLLITGPSAECVELLRLLSSVCRRALRVKLASTGAFSSLPFEFKPTLVLNQLGQSRRVLDCLVASGSSEFCFPAKGQLRFDCCAKIIYTGPSAVPLMGNFDLHVALTPRSGRVPWLTARVRDELAQKFQAMLLSYRLANYRHVLNPDFDAPEFTTHVRQCARQIGICINDPELQARLVSLLQQEEEAARAEATSSVLNIVIEAALLFCHEERESAYVNELTETVNTILEDRAESIRLSPKAVGAKLRSLGLKTCRLNQRGRGLAFTNEMCHKVHQLAHDFQVPTFLNSIDKFDCCRPFQDGTGHRRKE